MQPQIITNKLAFLMSTILAFFLDSFMVLFSEVVREPVKLFQPENKEFPERDCPACGDRHLIKNGSVHNGKPKYLCKSCGRQFVVNSVVLQKLIKDKRAVLINSS